MAKGQSQARYVELDLLRSAAVVMMIIYHIVYDLAEIYAWDIDPLTGGWKTLGRTTGSLFLLLVGISFSISWEKTVGPEYSGPTVYIKYFRRGLFIFACGMLITLVTFLFARDMYIRFGILHMIGVSIMLLPLFARLGTWNALLGIFVILCGALLPRTTIGTSLLLPLGFMPHGFATIDYYALIPWFGIVLIGFAIGSRFYVKDRTWRKDLEIDGRKDGSTRLASGALKVINVVTWPGRHALVIYMLHQPIILFFLSILL